MVYLVWRSARPWESEGDHLDSVHEDIDEAHVRVRVIEDAGAATLGRQTAWVEQIGFGEPRDKSVTET